MRKLRYWHFSVRTALVFGMCVCATACSGDSETATGPPRNQAPWTSTAIPWDSAEFGAADFRSDADSLWLISIGPLAPASNVWRVDPASGRLTRVRLAHFEDIVAGGGQLWGFGSEGIFEPKVSVTPTLHFIDLKGNEPRLVRKRLPLRFCEEADERPVVFRRRLWVLCGRRIYVFHPGRPRPVRTLSVASISALLPGADTLWGATSTEIIALNGQSEGVRVSIPAEFELYPGADGVWEIEGDQAWAYGIIGDEPALLRVDLPQRDAQTATVRQFGFGTEVVIVGDEVWVTQPDEVAIDRYSRADPGRFLGRLKLPLEPEPDVNSMSVASARGSAWVSVTTDETYLFRVARS